MVIYDKRTLAVSKVPSKAANEKARHTKNREGKEKAGSLRNSACIDWMADIGILIARGTSNHQSK
jgi:hypothetical protein